MAGANFPGLVESSAKGALNAIEHYTIGAIAGLFCESILPKTLLTGEDTDPVNLAVDSFVSLGVSGFISGLTVWLMSSVGMFEDDVTGGIWTMLGMWHSQPTLQRKLSLLTGWIKDSIEMPFMGVSKSVSGGPMMDGGNTNL